MMQCKMLITDNKLLISVQKRVKRGDPSHLVYHRVRRHTTALHRKTQEFS